MNNAGIGRLVAAAARLFRFCLPPHTIEESSRWRQLAAAIRDNNLF
jgi:hypothetical protein